MQKEHSDIQFQVGKTYPFTVNTIHDDFCELLDESGFQVYLQHTEGLNLVKGQKIQCLVKANTQRRPRIELVNADDYAIDSTKLSDESVDAIIKPIAEGWNTKPFTKLLMMSEVEDKSFEAECREWIHDLENDKQDLETIRRDCTRFMEESDFFGLCNPMERENYQQRLTLLIELLGYYIKADNLIAEGKGGEFLDGILNKLEKTGYVYHPQENFNVMSCLLLNDKDLMAGSISRLFDIIRHWPIEIWIKEPFKSTLIKVLNLYIEDNIWKVDRQDDNAGLVKSLIQAISIMLLLADNNDNRTPSLPDERLNLARICVLSTYQELFNNREVLDLAINCLAGRRYFRPYYTLADTETNRVTFLLKTYRPLSSPYPIDTTSSFISGRRRLELSPNGIALYSGDAKEKTVIPASLNLWANLQVYADRRMVPQLTGKINIRDCKRLWDDIEHDLFQQKAESHDTTANTITVTPTHDIGDHVTVNITRIAGDNSGHKSIAYCKIEGEDNESGYLYAEDIVSYMHQLDLWMFLDGNGRPLSLEAVIESEDSDGLFHLSMLDTIKDYVCKQHNPGDTIICSLGTQRAAGDQSIPVPAITPDGESVSLNGYSDTPLYTGDLVKAIYQNTATGTFHLFCSINARTEGEKVNVAQAFHNLMLQYAYEEAPVSDDDKTKEEEKGDDFEQNDRILDAAYIKEVIRIMDRMAFIDADYERSYNYLAFARVVCRLIGWGSQADYYRGRMQLIFLLYDFAVNDHVDTARLESLQNTDPDLFRYDTSMADKFKQLRIISYMGTRDNDNELWRYRSMEQGTTNKVASLAIAYNILKEAHMDNQANDVLNRVKDTLSLKGYESNLDTYGPGIETATVEYKQSIVYPSNNHMKPDMRRQLHKILEAITAFLNTQGGTLYIGVNNSGAGTGVEDDLDYREFNGDRDKYQRTVLDQVAIHLGNYFTTFLHTHWETGGKSGKQVLVVEVEPCKEGVSLDGDWLYRLDDSNRRLTKAEFEKYNTSRIEQMTRKKAAEEAKEKEKLQGPAVTDTPAAVTTGNHTAAQPKPEVTKIKTSSTRKNVLVDDGSEDYRPYVACLKFLPDNKFSKITYYDYDDTTALTLAVYDEETQDGSLVLGYADGSVAKVPLRELLKVDDYKEYTRNSDSPLLFATIASDNDGLVSVTREDKSKGRVMVRVDTIGHIEPGRLPDKGQRLYNEGLAKEVIAYETAPADELEPVANITDRDAKTLGQPLKTSPAKIKRALDKWGVKGVD